MSLRNWAKYVIERTPYRVLRKTDLNRFQAIDGCLALLHSLGYRPGVVIDGGAHLGDFSRLASHQFPAAKIHMVEPQPACIAALEFLARDKGCVLHPYLLTTDDEAADGRALLAIDESPNTGAYVVAHGSSANKVANVATTSLDRLFAHALNEDDRTLLKLDLQGYELFALAGAKSMLEYVEVILTEVSFFAQAYEPPITKLVSFLDEHGFDLFDIASMTSRARDGRARQADFLFVRRGSPLCRDTRWS